MIEDLIDEVIDKVIYTITRPLKFFDESSNLELLIDLASPIILAESKHAIKREGIRIDHSISREEAIKIISKTKWAQHWAESMCRLAGIEEGTPEFESCVQRLSRRVAERVV